MDVAHFVAAKCAGARAVPRDPQLHGQRVGGMKAKLVTDDGGDTAVARFNPSCEVGDCSRALGAGEIQDRGTANGVHAVEGCTVAQ